MRMTKEEYRAEALKWAALIKSNMESKDQIDRAYALYLRRFFFGVQGEISYTFAGNTWRRREQMRELPLSKDEYIIKTREVA